MSQLFYEKYQTLEKFELFDIVLRPEDYQPEAIPVAKQVISERGWSNELNEKMAEANKEREQKEEEFQHEVEEKAEYYKNVVEFKNQGNSFQVRIPDIPRFEGALEEHNIPYFREDKNIGPQLDAYPTQSYYFKNEHVDVVDQLSQDLGLVTAPYADIKPFFKFELKVLVIVIVIAVALVLFFS